MSMVVVVSPTHDHRIGGAQLPSYGLLMLAPSMLDEETQGSMRSSKSRPRSICWLHQTKGCHQGSRCNQVHVTKHYVNVIVSALSQQPGCCAAHGDTIAVLRTPTTVRFRDRVIPAHRFLQTRYWDNKSPRERLRWRNICNLHQNGVCSFGTQCRYVHMCRLLYQELLLPQQEEVGEQDPLADLADTLAVLQILIMQDSRAEELDRQKNVTQATVLLA